MGLKQKSFRLCMLLWLGFAAPVAGQPSGPSQAAIDEMVRIYCEAWGEPDVAKRRQLLERVWADDATYTDPVSHVAGHEALVERISAHLEKYRGSKIVPSSHADVHHGRLRFTWQFVLADGKIQIEGIDYGELTADGRIAKIVGFFGPLKSLQTK
jgi:hypothetical protein